MLQPRLSPTVLLLLAACGSTKKGDVDDQDDLPAGIAILDVERPVDVTPDGRTALVWNQSTADLSFYSTVSGELTPKTTLDLTNIFNQQPMALSASKRIAAIYGVPGEAGLWREDTGWVKLGNPEGDGCMDESADPPTATDVSTAFDLSDDGHVAVGMLWDGCVGGQAFRYDDASGAGEFTLLERLGETWDANPGFNRASVVTADGGVIGGWANNTVDRSPAIWQADGSGILLEPDNVDEPGEVKALSADGTIAAGDWAFKGFVWTAAAGVTRFTTDTPDNDNLFINAMSADGSFVFGGMSHTDDPTDFFAPRVNGAIVWDATNGIRSVQELATAAGITVPENTVLTSVQAVSADARVLVGAAEIPPPAEDPFGAPTLKVFVLVLPAGAL